MYNSGEKWEIVGKTIYKIMIGNYKNKLDDKGRLTIPSKFRNELGDVIVVSYGFDNTLEIRTKKAFEDWSNSLIAQGNLKSKARQLQRIVLGNSFEITLDKAGRANVSNDLLKLANIEKEVTLVGIGDKIEVHSTSQWESTMNESNDLATSMEELAEALAGE